MGSPYRDAPGRIPDELRSEERPQSLATFKASGSHGENGGHGVGGQHGSMSGASGSNGAHATPPIAGQSAGSIDLRLDTTDIENVASLTAKVTGPDGTVTPVELVKTIASHGSIELLALGGSGGHGGRGGHGGGGAQGSRGADATRYRSGSDGGTGGNGGNGGNGTSGADGGAGGVVRVEVDEDSTQLLMLIHHAVDGGDGGQRGHNGSGGSGGEGGAGGSSHSWTESDTYTDSEGNLQTNTTYHSNPGGSRGRRGMDGASGNVRIDPGENGADGRVVFAVVGESGVTEYATRYHLRLVSFEHVSSNRDMVYEPLETITVSGFEIENVGGMPTPSGADIHLSIEQQGWVNAEEGQHLVLPRHIAAGQRVKLEGQLTFRVTEFKPREASAPLEVFETVRPIARVVSVRRSFGSFQAGEALALGEFVIRHPVRVTEIESLRSLAPGGVARMRFSVTNQSRLDLGKDSETGRRLRVSIAALESELGDNEFWLFGDGDEPLAPSAGYSREIDLLAAGETEEIEISIGAKANAPAYRAITHRLVLELGDIEEPDALRTIQLRDFTTRIANRYKADPSADLLLVVNHQTTAQEVTTWRTLATQLGFIANLWDITLERHLELRADLGHGRCLLDHFAGNTIAIINNTVEAGGARRRPHELLSKADLYAANSEGIHLAVIGADPDLERLLMPTQATEDQLAEQHQADSPDELVTALATIPSRAMVVSDGKVEYHDRQWWGGLPDVTDISEEADGLQDDLVAAYPDRRYVVVYDFEPEVASKFLWVKKWRMGEVEVKSTLDPVAGSVVHAALSDLDIHSPLHILGDAVISTLLLARPFAANIENLDRLLASGQMPLLEAPSSDEDKSPPAPPPSTNVASGSIDVARLTGLLIGAMLTELAGEQDAIVATRWREGLSRDEIRGKMPWLRALSNTPLGGGNLLPGTAEGTHVVELVARLRFFAEGKVKLWERTPPIRFLRRAPTVAAIAKKWLDDLLKNTFGEHEKPARKMMKKRLSHFEDSDPGRGYLGNQLLYEPINREDITTDDEAFSDAGARVLSREEFEAVAAADAASVVARTALLEKQRSSEQALLRAESTASLSNA